MEASHGQGPGVCLRQTSQGPAHHREQLALRARLGISLLEALRLLVEVLNRALLLPREGPKGKGGAGEEL